MDLTGVVYHTTPPPSKQNILGGVKNIFYFSRLHFNSFWEIVVRAIVLLNSEAFFKSHSFYYFGNDTVFTLKNIERKK